jgi:hypothetical protein
VGKTTTVVFSVTIVSRPNVRKIDSKILASISYSKYFGMSFYASVSSPNIFLEIAKFPPLDVTKPFAFS